MYSLPKNCSPSLAFSSLLFNESILALFEVSEPETESIYNHFACQNVYDFEFFSIYRERLRYFGVFDGDDASILLRFSFSYLCNIFQGDEVDSLVCLIEAETFKIIGRKPRLATSRMATQKVLDIQIALPYLSLPIEDVLHDKIISEALLNQGFDNWRLILETTEKLVVEELGLSWAAYKRLEAINQLRYWLSSPGSSSKLSVLTSSFGDWSSLSSLLRSWLLDTVKGANTERNVDMLMMRFGWKTGRPATLENTAAYFGGMTRERTRQIEKKWKEKIQEWGSAQKIEPLWINLVGLLRKKGVIRLRDFLRELRLNYGWTDRLSEKSLIHLILMCPENISSHFTVYSKSLLYSNDLSKCFECSVLNGFFDVYFDEIPFSSIEEFSRSVQYECNKNCVYQNNSSLFNLSFYEVLFEKNIESLSSYRLNRKDSSISTELYYKSRHGSLVATMEFLLLKARKSLHFTKVYEIFKEFRSDYEINERSIHANITRSENILLWGRGTFIHKKWVSFPYRLIRDIEETVFLKLKGGIPIISSFGPFNDFKERCIMEGVPNENALYSCLKLSGDSRFSFPHQPYISLKESDSFSSLTNVLEDFVKESDGDVLYSKIKDYAINHLQIKEFQLNNNIIRTNNIFGTPNYGYIHSDNLNLDMDIISSIIDHTKSTIERFGHVSINKIFKEQIINCKLIGIDNYKILGSIIKSFDSGLFKIVNNNRISCAVDSINKTNSFVSEVTEYIKSLDRPCYTKELHDYFVDERGYKDNSLSAAFYSGELFRYLPGCVLHRESIGFNADLERQFLESVESNYTDQVESGDFCGFIDALLENYNLPELENGVFWTETLAADIIEKTSGFKMLGYHKNPYVSEDLRFGISSFEDLLLELLNSKFGGSCNYSEFLNYLSGKGIISRKIPVNILNSFQKILIQNKEIFSNG